MLLQFLQSFVLFIVIKLDPNCDHTVSHTQNNYVRYGTINS